MQVSHHIWQAVSWLVAVALTACALVVCCQPSASSLSDLSEEGAILEGAEKHVPRPGHSTTAKGDAVAESDAIRRLPPPEQDLPWSWGDELSEEAVPTYTTPAKWAPLERRRQEQRLMDRTELLPSRFSVLSPSAPRSSLSQQAPAAKNVVSKKKREAIDPDGQWAARTTAEQVREQFPAEVEMGAEFRPLIQDAFSLARAGALHAGKMRLEEAVEDLVRAKDVRQKSDRHLRAWKAGLRALTEADEFLAITDNPAEEVRRLAAYHQTPVLRQDRSAQVLPHEAIAKYHLYAERKLAEAVAQEQGGSMALYGLGKIYQQFAERDEEVLQPLKKSLTLYRSAVAAHPENFLAANEVGVLLVRAGRYEQAKTMLQQAVRHGGLATTYENLAYVEHQLGHQHQATVMQAMAQQLAVQEREQGLRSIEHGIAWLSPSEFRRHSDSPQGPTTNYHTAELDPESAVETDEQPTSTWQKAVDLAKRMTDFTPTK